jgi:aminopeptidase N
MIHLGTIAALAIWVASVASAEDGPVLQPDARRAAVPDRAFDLERLNLDIELLPAERSIVGTATYSAKRLSAGPLVLDQVALDFTAVTVAGESVDWRVLGDTIEIPVGDAIVRGGTVEIVIDYRATPEKGLHFRESGGGSPDAYAEIWSQGQKQDNRYWFPTWDHPNERFKYTGNVRAPAGWKTHTNSGTELPAYLVMLAAGPYRVVGEANNQLWVGPRTPDAAVQTALGLVPSIVSHFEARTGVPYPWNALRQFFVQRFLYGGMENTAAIINTDSVLVGAAFSETRDRLPGLMAHEIAHQWYGDLLTCRSWRDLWLNEGFASFMEADWSAAQATADKWADEVWSWKKHSQNERPLAGRFHHGPEASANHNVYSKGAMVLQMLRTLLGEDVFWAGIQGYTQAHAHGLVETVDLQRSMEHVSGQELGWFFQQWVELPHVPRLTVTRKYADGRLKVRIKQAASDTRPIYTLPIDVEVGTADGVIRRREWLSDDTLELVFELAEAPLYVAFDPDGGVLAKVEDEQEPDAWEAQLGSPSPLAVRAAISALSDTKKSDGLAKVLGDSQRSPLVRAAAAKALGAQRNSDLLRPFLLGQHGRVREAVIRGLGRGTDTGVLSKLESIARSDRNPDIRRAALSAVANLSASRGVTLARALLRSSGGDGRLAGSAAGVIGKEGATSDLSVVLSEGAFRASRNAGLWAAARIVSRQDAGPKRRAAARKVARALERHVNDLDYRTRYAVVNLLGEVGDERSIPVLEALRRRTSVQSLAGEARKSIKKIRSRDKATPADTPAEAEAAMKDLEDRIETLESEMKKWRDKH